MPSDRAAPYISCVVPAYNEARNIEALLDALHLELGKTGSRFEIIVIDDGSTDATAELVIGRSADQTVRLVQLSRNFGKENALTAGIDHASGNVVILLDADLQHPVSVIPEMLKRWREGYDMVYAVQIRRDQMSVMRRLGTRFFYSLLSRLSHIDIPEDAGDFRLLDRKVVEALRSLPERGRFMKGLYSWVGFKKIGVPFSTELRAAGKSKFNLRKLGELALTGITSFSEWPLRIWSMIGAGISLLAFLYASWIVIETLAFGIDVPGWATLSVAVMFFGGVQLLSIGILGEYVGRIFNEVKRRPPYLITRRHGFSENQSPPGQY